MAKIDLKDAYFLVPIHPAHQKFLQFQWMGITYQFCCLPFGLSYAPRTFTKLMKPVVAFLRERGIKLIIYLDDLIIFCNNWEMLTHQLTLVQELFHSFRLTITYKKSQLIPTQELTFLGLMISTTSMTVSLPKEKLAKLKQVAKSLLLKSEVTVQRLAAFVGMTTAAKQAVRMSPLFHCQLQALINRVVPLVTLLEEVKQSYHQMVELSQEAREELAWWANKVQRFNSAPLLMKTSDMVIESDASCLGWGMTLKSQQVRTGGLWSTEEQKLHINCLELTAVLMAVKSFAKDRMSINILVRTDNILARAYVNHLGGTHSHPMNTVATRAIEVVHQQEHQQSISQA